MLTLKTRKGGLSTYTSSFHTGEMSIKTDNKARNIIYGYELTEEEQKEFDYLDFTEPDPNDADGDYGGGLTRHFVRFKGQILDIGDFMSCHNSFYSPNCPFKDIGWDGYSSDSFFSGVLIKYTEDNESVIVGEYIA